MRLKERVKQIEGLHTRLSAPEKELALALALGYDNDDLRQLLGKSTPTIYRKIDDLGYIIFEKTEFEYDRGMIAAWAFLHHSCCMGDAFAGLT